MIENIEQKSPLACLYHWEKATPDRVHFVQPYGGGEVRELTWAQAMDQARRMAAYIKSLDFPAGSQIAILGKNSAHWLIADWAIWMAGHVSVPLYPTLNADTVQYILEHSESRLLFVGKLDTWDEMKPGVPADLPVVTLPLSPDAPKEDHYKNWDEIVASTEPLQGEPDRDLSELATIVYTSGSTGRPKGVMQSFKSFNVCGTLMNDLVTADENDRMLSYLPLAHVAERIVVGNNSTYYGFCVYFAESLETFLSDLQRAKPTIFFSVPRLWTKFHLGVCSKLPMKKQKILFNIPFLGKKVKHKVLAGLGLEHVRIALTGAAPLPPPIIKWYNDLGLELLEAYGMSENMAYSHFTRPGEARIGYVGHANKGVEHRIDPDTGEIQVKSPGQMMGYYKQPEKTAEEMTDDGFFKTGDMGEIDEAGRLRITGRVKDLFKTSKGKYVAPVPIENKLGAHPLVEVSCVCGQDRPATFVLILLGEDTQAALAKGGDKSAIEAQLSDLLDQVNPSLDPHEQMAFAVVVKDPWGIENNMLTPTMKIKRNVIEEHYEPQVDGWFAAKQKVIWE